MAAVPHDAAGLARPAKAGRQAATATGSPPRRALLAACRIDSPAPARSRVRPARGLHRRQRRRASVALRFVSCCPEPMALSQRSLLQHGGSLRMSAVGGGRTYLRLPLVPPSAERGWHRQERRAARCAPATRPPSNGRAAAKGFCSPAFVHCSSHSESCRYRCCAAVQNASEAAGSRGSGGGALPARYDSHSGRFFHDIAPAGTVLLIAW